MKWVNYKDALGIYNWNFTHILSIRQKVKWCLYKCFLATSITKIRYFPHWWPPRPRPQCGIKCCWKIYLYYIHIRIYQIFVMLCFITILFMNRFVYYEACVEVFQRSGQSSLYKFKFQIMYKKWKVKKLLLVTVRSWYKCQENFWFRL